MGTEETPIDLRSDTVTLPDEAMLEAIRSAPLGDDVFESDPTVHALEAESARVTGKEAGLFVPSGTMGNQLAIAVQTRPGDEVILESRSHSFNFECAGPSRLWGVQPRPLAGERGAVPLEQIEAAVRPENVHLPRTSLVILEQTSNIPGGCVLPLEYLRSVGAFTRKQGLRFHIDGARVFHASVAEGIPVAEYAACADTLTFCFSKGLGAPVGSVLVGRRETIAEARKVRKLLGGGMRQAGIIAAAALYALENNVERLAEDHRRARRMAEALAPLASRGLSVPLPETNMVYLSWEGEDPRRYEKTVSSLEERGVLAVALPGRGIRLVLHKDIDDSDLKRSIRVVRDALEEVFSSFSPP